MMPRILLAGGGTGGHLFPALAVAEVLRDKGSDVLFVGTRSGLEARVLPEKGFRLECLWLSGFNRRRILSNLLLPAKIPVSFIQSFRILSSFRPQVALGTGGYVCGPILVAASICRVPVVLQEQNSFPGITTRWLARLSGEVYLNFEEAASYLPPRTRWRQLGNPVRSGFTRLDRQLASERWGLNPSLPTLLVFGGSQGAMSVNRAVAEILPRLSPICNLIWSRGRLDTSQPSGWSGPGVLVVKPFIDDMSSAYAAADLAICRSGALTLSELQSARLPAILVPYPYAAGDHQKHNALAFAKRGGAVVIENRELNAQKLFEEITSLLGTCERLDSMRKSLAAQPAEDAAATIADDLLRIAHESEKKGVSSKSESS